MSNLLWNKIEQIDPDLAKLYLTTNVFPRQRPLRQSQVELLAGALRKKTFKSGTIEICTYEHNDYLMDGQHRLTAIVQSGIGAKMSVAYFEATTEEELNAHYYRCDLGNKRTPTDVYRAADASRNLCIEPKYLRYVGSSVDLAEDLNAKQMQTGRINVEQRLIRMRAWSGEAKAYLTAIEGRPKSLQQPMLNASVMAVALNTFRARPIDARNFWHEVAMNDGLKKGEPSHTLVDALLDPVFRSKAPEWIIRACAYCWNAWNEDRELKMIRLPQPYHNYPVNLKFTQYKAD